jgi:hypothetical protein
MDTNNINQLLMAAKKEVTGEYITDIRVLNILIISLQDQIFDLKKEINLLKKENTNIKANIESVPKEEDNANTDVVQDEIKANTESVPKEEVNANTDVVQGEVKEKEWQLIEEKPKIKYGKIGYIKPDTMEGPYIHKSLVYPVKDLNENFRPYIHGKVGIECKEVPSGHRFETWTYKSLNDNLPIDRVTCIYKHGNQHISKVKNLSFLLVINDNGKTMGFTELKEYFKKEGLLNLPNVDIKKVKNDIKYQKPCIYGSECDNKYCKYIHEDEDVVENDDVEDDVVENDDVENDDVEDTDKVVYHGTYDDESTRDAW